MPIVKTTQVVEAPVGEVWSSWDAFGDIRKFHPGLESSFLLGKSSATGLGAQRQCDFADGKNFVREKIIGYSPERQMVVDVYESSTPLKRAIVTIDLRPLDAKRTQINVSIDFSAKLGLLGKLLEFPMRKQFLNTFDELLLRNAQFVESRIM